MGTPMAFTIAIPKPVMDTSETRYRDPGNTRGVPQKRVARVPGNTMLEFPECLTGYHGGIREE